MRGADLSEKQLRDDLMTMLIAGHETTAAVLTWTLFALLQHPKALATVLSEIDTVLGDRIPGVQMPCVCGLLDTAHASANCLATHNLTVLTMCARSN